MARKEGTELKPAAAGLLVQQLLEKLVQKKVLTVQDMRDLMSTSGESLTDADKLLQRIISNNGGNIEEEAPDR